MNNLKELIEYLDKHGVRYSIDYNPSPEKIKKIKERLKKMNY